MDKVDAVVSRNISLNIVVSWINWFQVNIHPCHTKLLHILAHSNVHD